MNPKSVKITLVAFAMLLLWLGFPISSASTGPSTATSDTIPFECDVTINGAIDDPIERDFLVFSVAEGERVTISLINGTPVGSNFNVVGRLLRGDGSPAASCGTYVIGGNNRIINCGPLPASGNPYRVEVVDGSLNDTGAYRAQLQRLTVPAACDNTLLSCNAAFTGAIDSPVDTDLLTFNVSEDEIVTLSLINGTSARPNFNVVGRLLQGDGSPAASCGSYVIGGNNRIINCGPLPTSGNPYRVEVVDSSLNDTGAYRIQLQRLTATAACSLLPINCDVTVTRSLDSPVDTDLLNFTVAEGERVTISLINGTPAGSNFNVVGRLLRGDGSPAASCGTYVIGGNNRIINCGPLPASGNPYQVEVVDGSLNDTGTYSIQLQRLTAQAACEIIPLTCGVPFPGTIGSPVDTDLLSFCVADGERVTISLVNDTPAGSNFNVVGRLLRGDGSPAASCGSYVIGGNNRIIDCGPLPASGNPYRIEVVDGSLNDTGAYRAIVSCLTSNCQIGTTTISLAPNSLMITAGSPGSMAATIGTAQSTDTLVLLSSSNSNVARVPASVTIRRNMTSEPFPVEGIAPGTATITATLLPSLGGSATANVTVREPLPACLPNTGLPSGFRPFTQIYYITGPNAAGDRLVVGRMLPSQPNAVSLPNQPNQRFCDPVELAPGLLAIAYVPTPAERSGDFNAFAGLLLDPIISMPFPNGIIPANRLGDPHAWRIVNQVGGPALVNAASYSAVELAVESIAAIFGARLATDTRAATSLPLPTVLEGSTVKVRDSAGVTRDAPLFFVSPDQINFQVPPGTMEGVATATITSGNGSVSIGTVQIVRVAPALFAANANGREVAAGVALRVRANGEQVFESIARLDEVQGKFVTVPIDLGPETDQVFLILFGTGLRHRSSLATVSASLGGDNMEVLFAGALTDFVGLDQINLRLARSLAGRGEVDVVLRVEDKTANTVRVSIR